MMRVMMMRTMMMMMIGIIHLMSVDKGMLKESMFNLDLWVKAKMVSQDQMLM